MSHYEITLRSGGSLKIVAELSSDSDANAFAIAFNGARAGAWPEDEQNEQDAQGEAGGVGQDDAHAAEPAAAADAADASADAAAAPPAPGARKAQVLQCLRAGIVDVVAIADGCDMRTADAARLKKQLIAEGVWTEGGL